MPPAPQAQVLVGQFGSLPSGGSPYHQPAFQQIGLDHIHQGIGFFLKGGGNGLNAGRPAVVGEGARIGGNAVVCGGITVGNNAVVEAGACVEDDVPDGGVWMGGRLAAVDEG